MSHRGTLSKLLQSRDRQEAVSAEAGPPALPDIGLVAQCDPKAPCTGEEREWLDSKAKGEELF